MCILLCLQNKIRVLMSQADLHAPMNFLNVGKHNFEFGKFEKLAGC